MTESIWDYPRPPRVEPSERHVRVVHGGEVVADTRRAVRVLETTHPPSWYVPREDVRADLLEPVGRTTFCEWKGHASYFDVVAGGGRAARAAWTYPEPSPGFESIRDHVAFYADRVDECTVDGERAEPEGGYYGGWITGDVDVSRR